MTGGLQNLVHGGSYHPQPDGGTATHPAVFAGSTSQRAPPGDSCCGLQTTEGFVSYLEQTTPITVIEDLNLGSRPASRSDERRVEDLRAIPWVFSWTQARCIIPGWYSLATGLDAYLDDGGDLATLREMYDKWAFFRTMLDNAALALAKTDLVIAAEYASLAPSDLRAEFFPRICNEYERASELVRTVTGRKSQLEREWLQEPLQRRNPYVDPLNRI